MFMKEKAIKKTKMLDNVFDTLQFEFIEDYSTERLCLTNLCVEYFC